ncbi:hypothetical protein K504DRAFT_460356 [Pleomassaria siparia CBS 279.74]|uniref:Uncharacterized protein n=1 Tax=Pleomassaria siparia CBS 279.74 TaxID=1314801 RepID=A0A6G1JYL5_9PLEO|nr:hypothetical protein K504DRAFT_460356 [Pleomassaria siparia CBS 279.74]
MRGQDCPGSHGAPASNPSSKYYVCMQEPLPSAFEGVSSGNSLDEQRAIDIEGPVLEVKLKRTVDSYMTTAHTPSNLPYRIASHRIMAPWHHDV